MERPRARWSCLRPSRRFLLAPALGGLVLLTTASAPPATRAPKALAVSQLAFPIPLVAPGDLVEMGYDTRKVPSATGFVYVRNDLQRGYTRVALKLRKAKEQLVPSDRLKLLRAAVPARLLRGHRLFYYAVVRDPRTGRSSRIPSKGSESLWVLGPATVVNLGIHQFGHVASPDAVVARADASSVGFENPPEGARYGPWSFEIASDGTVWLLDEVNSRLLVWAPAQRDTVERTVPLETPIDFALGPGGTLYITRPANPSDPPAYPGGLPPIRLVHVSPTGEPLWESRLDTDIFNTQLRTGPGGILYWTTPGFSPRSERGSEHVWVPAATAAGDPLSIAEQRRGKLEGYQPLPGGLRLISAAARFQPDPDFGVAPHEERIALINRVGGLVRGWRVSSKTVIWPKTDATPALAGVDPVVVVLATAMVGGSFRQEYVVLRLATAGGTRVRLSLAPAAWGDVITDLRIASDGTLYQLGSSPSTGVVISRFSLGPVG